MRTAPILPEALASPRLTLAALALLGAGAVAQGFAPGDATWLVVTPLALCALNLIAAVLRHAAFRRNPALLAFHLALLGLVLLAAAGRLTFLKGRLELSEGEAFGGRLSKVEAGPLHRSALEQAQFVNEGFTIRYGKGVRRAETRNAVRWIDDNGSAQRAVIGDDEPLTLRGYRFYTSFNKGFAPVFVWRPAAGAPQRGTIHLPAYPIHEHRQALDWTLPGTGTALWTMLQFDEPLLDPEKVSQFRLPERHTLVVRVGEDRHELSPGASLALRDGVLVYERLSAWMGYTVFYDWTLPWLFVASLLAFASLAWHFLRKFAARPWNA